jgi:hypothetical protein
MVVFHLLLPLVLALSADCPAQRAVIGGLVQQLGSRSYREREMASAALESIGEIANPALQKATNSKDAEIRRRAKRLVQALAEQLEWAAVEKRVRDIQKGKFSPREKGRELVKVLATGTHWQRARALLGEPSHSSCAALENRKCIVAYYTEYGLLLFYDPSEACCLIGFLPESAP